LNFSDVLLHTMLCPVLLILYVSFLTMRLFCCIYQFTLVPFDLHGAPLFYFQVFLLKTVVICTYI